MKSQRRILSNQAPRSLAEMLPERQALTTIDRLVKGIVFLLFVSSASASDQVSVEDFKKQSPEERRRLIQESPSEQKEELTRIDDDLVSKVKWGGEEGWKGRQE